MFNRTSRLEKENRRLSIENQRLAGENARLTREVELLRDRMFAPIVPYQPVMPWWQWPTITSDRTYGTGFYPPNTAGPVATWGEGTTQTISTPVGEWDIGHIVQAIKGDVVQIDRWDFARVAQEMQKGT